MKTPAQWTAILIECGVSLQNAVQWADSFAAELLESSFSQGAKEIDDFLANILHESAMLNRVAENLNYSADALISLFGRHRISTEDAQRYGRTDSHPAQLVEVANCLYGGAWGAKNLGNTQPGDPWMFRGSGLIQVTGRSNFEYLERLTGLPLVKNPDMLRRPGPEALAVAVHWWEGRVPDAVIGDVVKTRRAVNGGTMGLEHVTALTDKVGGALA